MRATITIPADLEPRLRGVADARGRTVEEVALDILRAGRHGAPYDGDDLDLGLDAVAAAIRALPPNPRAIRPGRGSLLDFLAGKITDGPFDLATREAAWATVEAELTARARADG